MLYVVYSEWFQNDLRQFLVEYVNRTQNINLKLNDLSLKFPLEIELDEAVVTQDNDTLIAANKLIVDVELFPLLKGDIAVSKVLFSGVFYQMGEDDATMRMNISTPSAKIIDSKITFSLDNVEVGKVEIDGGHVGLDLKNDTTKISGDTIQSKPLNINVAEIVLKNFCYDMSIEASIDTLATQFNTGHLKNVCVDLGTQKISASSIRGDSLSLSYIATDTIIENNDSDPSMPWEIMVDTIDFTNSKILYALGGVIPKPGFDFNYICVDSLNVNVVSFYNCASNIRIPIVELNAYERCGVDVASSGMIAVSDDTISMKQFKLLVGESHLNMDGMIGKGEIISDNNMQMSMVGDVELAVEDIKKVCPIYMPIAEGMSQQDKLIATIDVGGGFDDLTINELFIDVAGRANASVNGHIANLFDEGKRNGHLNVVGEIVDADFVNSCIADDVDEFIILPAMAVTGDVIMKSGNINGNIKARTNSGDLALSAIWKSYTQGYDIDLKMHQFPIDAFMPRIGVGNVSGTMIAKGHRFNPFEMKMDADVVLDIESADYYGTNYESILTTLVLNDRNAKITISSNNTAADFDVVSTAQFGESTVKWDLNSIVRNCDLKVLNLLDQRAKTSAIVSSNGVLDIVKNKIDAELQIDDFKWQSDSLNMSLKDINAKFLSSDSGVNLSLRNDDLNAYINTNETIDSLMIKLEKTIALVNNQIQNHQVDVIQIQQSMPKLNVDLTAGNNNIITKYLASKGYGFNQLMLEAGNDSLINMRANVLGCDVGTAIVDTISFEANQCDKILMYNASIGNQKGTLDKLAYVSLSGYVADDLLSAHLKQYNIEGKEGYNIGAMLQMGDSIARIELFPENPIIGYKKWNINNDNYVEYNVKNRHIDADVSMVNESSLLEIYTEHNESLSSYQEDIILKIKDFNLTEWIAFNPYAHPIKGLISADVKVNWGDGRLNGNGSALLEDLMYGKERIGTLATEFDISTNKLGQMNADVDLMVDGTKAMTISGILNDSVAQSPLMLDLLMTHFPLRVLNPFLPRGTASLNGALNGTMTICGDGSTPIFNGKLDFDSTTIYVDMIGTTLALSEDEISVTNNKINFSDFSIVGVNNNPLKINGVVDVADLVSPYLDLTLKAKDMQLVGSNRSKRTNVYGKAFVDIDANVKGRLSYLDVNAKIDLLGGSNVTYVVPDATSTLSSYSTNEMVKFVNFSDTTMVASEEELEPQMMIAMNVALSVSDGTVISVDLSSDGKNKVQLQGNGKLNYSVNAMQDARLTGKYVVNSGFVRYTPPLMTEKLFNFKAGSYVAFNGDTMNPVLNISAVDKIKASVTQASQDSKLVNFDVSILVTNTLQDMNVVFDLATSDDVSIANELSSMSAEQRANQAMNLLLYNVYTGTSYKGNSNFSGNPLYSFVESTLNTWMANNVGFVDVTFGIDQYDKTSEGSKTTATSYSYKVSKTLFNNRFKIIVGGNYTTDAADNEDYSQSLINDVSVEYMLNRSGSMYVKLFRKVGYESILEGEIVQTGVGFVYKRKLRTLKDIFKKGETK